eukprot:1160226-Pelagomonas_calceolata.AAC.5
MIGGIKGRGEIHNEGLDVLNLRSAEERVLSTRSVNASPALIYFYTLASYGGIAGNSFHGSTWLAIKEARLDTFSPCVKFEGNSFHLACLKGCSHPCTYIRAAQLPCPKAQTLFDLHDALRTQTHLKRRLKRQTEVGPQSYCLSASHSPQKG